MNSKKNSCRGNYMRKYGNHSLNNSQFHKSPNFLLTKKSVADWCLRKKEFFKILYINLIFIIFFLIFSAKWLTSNEKVSKFRSQAKTGSSAGNGNGKLEKIWTLCTVRRSSKFFLFAVSVFGWGACFDLISELANFFKNVFYIFDMFYIPKISRSF